MSKQLVWRTKEVDISWRPLADAIKILQALAVEHPTANMTRRWEDGYDLAIEWEECETDQEAARRIGIEQTNREYMRRQYEKLRKVFDRDNGGAK